MFLKLFNKELYYLLKKTGVTYIATVCGALICLGITSLANVMYSVEPEMMWCLRIIGVFFFAVSVLLCISVQLLVFIRRFTSTVIGNEGYLTFSLPASTYSIVAAKVLATLCCSMLPLLYLPRSEFVRRFVLRLSAFAFTFLRLTHFIWAAVRSSSLGFRALSLSASVRFRALFCTSCFAQNSKKG